MTDSKATEVSNVNRAKALLADQTVEVGAGRESHQSADSDGPTPTATLTTNLGVPIADNQNSLKPGARGPTLLEDFILREKVFHFDHERIPERVVHARGISAHGYFETYESLADITSADISNAPARRLPPLRAFPRWQATEVRRMSRATSGASRSSCTPKQVL